jgi:hypothetical protein
MQNNTKLAFILVTVIVLAVGGFVIYQLHLVQEGQDRQAAEARLQAMMAKKQWADEQAAQNQRWAEQIEAQRQAEAAKPHYSPQRLAAAAKPRTWAHVEVPDLNIQCVLNTVWSDGQLHYRVAFLGQKQALDNFVAAYKEFRINFCDQSGSTTFDFGIDPNAFQLDPPSVNGGIPTFETSNSVECDLARYEVSVQWNLTWVQ